MDLKRLHKAATDALSGNGVNAEMAYAMQVLQLLTSPDPLTLDAAVQVMGREPDDRRIVHDWESRSWGERQHQRYVRVSQHAGNDLGCEVFGKSLDNPTIGQFACLVLAAKMGEKA